MSKLTDLIDFIRSRQSYDEKCQAYIDLVKMHQKKLKDNIEALEKLCVSIVDFLNAVESDDLSEERKATVDKCQRTLDALNRFIEKVKELDL